MIVFVDGKRQERLPHIAFDQPAVLYGCSLFETMRVFSQGLYRVEAHIDRLISGVETLGWPMSGGKSDFSKVLATRVYAAAAAFRDSYDTEGRLRLTYLLLDGAARDVITVAPYQHQSKWARVVVSSVLLYAGDVRSGLKTGNYLAYHQARREAVRTGADEALLISPDDDIAEGSISNIFLILPDRLLTPSLELGILPGTMRAHVLQLARSIGLRVDEGRVKKEDFRFAEGAFLTNAVRGIWPVSLLESHVVNPEHAVLKKLEASLRKDICERARWGTT